MKLIFLVASVVATIVLTKCQADAAPLTWAPPALTAPTTLQINDPKYGANHTLKLDQTKDYILNLPASGELVGGITIYGGRNVVLIGGNINVPTLTENPSFTGQKRGMYLQAQTGVCYIEGVHIKGNGLQEGINLDQRLGATVILQNVRVDRAQGSQSTNHADVIQTWAGPRKLLIDTFTGKTTYQGFFLLPTQHDASALPVKFDFRNVNLNGSQDSAYMLWCEANSPFPISVTNVWVDPADWREDNRDMYLWPKPSTGSTIWNPVREGITASGDFVKWRGGSPSYISPGYLNTPY